MRSRMATREYLLDIAVEEFALNGFEKTSLRSIAKAADVSPALLIHYFTNRDQLISAAINETLGVWIGEEKAALTKQAETRISDWVQLVEHGKVKLAFLRQVLLANNHYTTALFASALAETRHMIEVAVSAGTMQEIDDVETTAVLLTSQALASIVFLPQLEQSLGGSLADQAVALKLFNAQTKLLNFSMNLKEGN